MECDAYAFAALCGALAGHCLEHAHMENKRDG